MILCFYRLKVEIFKEKHKIIDVPIYPHLSIYPPSLAKCTKKITFNAQVLASHLLGAIFVDWELDLKIRICFGKF